MLTLTCSICKRDLHVELGIREILVDPCDCLREEAYEDGNEISDLEDELNNAAMRVDELEEELEELKKCLKT